MKFQLCVKTVDKVWCYWEHLGETHQGGKMLGKPLGNRSGTWWEHQNHQKNTPRPFLPQKEKKRALGTYREQIGDMVGTPKSQKMDPSPSAPFSPPKEKNMNPPRCMLNHLIGCMKTLFLKLFVTIFGLG